MWWLSEEVHQCQWVEVMLFHHLTTIHSASNLNISPIFVELTGRQQTANPVVLKKNWRWNGHRPILPDTTATLLILMVSPFDFSEDP